MVDEKNLACTRFICTVIAPILYFIVFAVDSVHWVEDDEFFWGLWKYRNRTDHMHQGTIAPGDSPGYFEAARVLSCFVLVCFILFYFTFDPNKGLGHEWNPVILAFFTVLQLTIVLGLVGGGYKNDERFEFYNPRLGWCYWVALAADIIASFTGIVMFLMAHQRIQTQKKKVAPKPKPKPKVEPKPQKKLVEKPLPPLKQPETKSAVSRNSITEDEGQERKGAASKDLSPYVIPADPGIATPEIPDYHVAVNEGSVDPPTPVALPASSPWRKTTNYLKHYMKSAVGRGSAYEKGKNNKTVML